MFSPFGLQSSARRRGGIGGAAGADDEPPESSSGRTQPGSSIASSSASLPATPNLRRRTRASAGGRKDSAQVPASGSGIGPAWRDRMLMGYLPGSFVGAQCDRVRPREFQGALPEELRYGAQPAPAGRSAVLWHPHVHIFWYCKVVPYHTCRYCSTSIQFHLLVPGGKWHARIFLPHSSASSCNCTFYDESDLRVLSPSDRRPRRRRPEGRVPMDLVHREQSASRHVTPSRLGPRNSPARRCARADRRHRARREGVRTSSPPHSRRSVPRRASSRSRRRRAPTAPSCA